MRETPETALLLDLPRRPSLNGLLEPPRLRRPVRPTAETKAKSTVPASPPQIDPALGEARMARIARRLDELAAAIGPSFEAFAATFDFAGLRSFADIGGAAALLSCLVAARHPEIACRSFEPEILRPLAERRIRERGLAGRVRAQAIDIVADAFPVADVIAMSVILHDWNPQRKKMLLAKAHRALPVGGAMVAIACLDDGAHDGGDGLVPVPGGAIEFGDSDDMTGAQFRRWCGEAGFVRCDVLRLSATASATIARK